MRKSSKLFTGYVYSFISSARKNYMNVIWLLIGK